MSPASERGRHQPQTSVPGGQQCPLVSPDLWAWGFGTQISGHGVTDVPKSPGTEVSNVPRRPQTSN